MLERGAEATAGRVMDRYNNNDENFRMVAEILTVIGVMDDSNNFW